MRAGDKYYIAAQAMLAASFAATGDAKLWCIGLGVVQLLLMVISYRTDE